MVAGRSIRIGVGWAPVRGPPLSSLVIFDDSTADTSTDWAISSDGLTVARNSNTGNATAIATLGKSSTTGEGYFEVLCAAASAGVDGIGLGISASGTDYLHDFGFAYLTDNRLDFQNSALSTGATWTTADRIGIYLKNGKVWAHKNGTWQGSGGDPSAAGAGLSLTGIAATIYPAVFTNSANASFTANFGASALTYSIPSGGSSWDGTQSASSSATVALTGQSITAAQGSLLAAAALPLSGQSVTAAQGSVAPNITIALTGQSLTVARGTVTPTTSTALAGQTITAAQGSVSPATTASLSGQSLATAQGSLAHTTAITLSGQTIAAAQGTLTLSISRALTGQALIVAQGSVTAGFGFALTGQSISAAQGSIAASTIVALLGQSTGLSQGTIIGGLVLPTPPYVPPTISFGFRKSLPASVNWGAGDSTGTAWQPDDEPQNNWTDSGGQTGANWKKS